VLYLVIEFAHPKFLRLFLKLFTFFLNYAVLFERNNDWFVLAIKLSSTKLAVIHNFNLYSFFQDQKYFGYNLIALCQKISKAVVLNLFKAATPLNSEYFFATHKNFQLTTTLGELIYNGSKLK
jgi:hypothetical protein